MPDDDIDALPAGLPARAVELLQLVDAGAVLAKQQPHYSAVTMTFALAAPTALWPESEWLSLPRYLFSAGREGLVELAWSWHRSGEGCTLRLTELGRAHTVGCLPLMMLQPEDGERGWRANPTSTLKPWQLCAGNIVHTANPDEPGLRMQIGTVKHRQGTVTAFCVRTEKHLEFTAADTVTVETASLSAAQAAAVAQQPLAATAA